MGNKRQILEEFVTWLVLTKGVSLVRKPAEEQKHVELRSAMGLVGEYFFEEERKNPPKLTLPKGTYIISDPCYVLGNSHYQQLLTETKFFGAELPGRGGVFTDPRSGLQFAVFRTCWGDGAYKDNQGNTYGVDSGCIGCIPTVICKAKHGDIVHVHDFAKEFEVSNMGEDMRLGLLKFGDVIIDTRGESGDE
jgi:hypothetical protein